MGSTCTGSHRSSLTRLLAVDTAMDVRGPRWHRRRLISRWLWVWVGSAVEAGAFDALTESTGSAGGQLVYLRHGEDDAPKVFAQDPLRSKPHLTDDPAELAHPTWVHQRLAAAKETLAEGRFDATPGSACRWCSFRSSCPATSGQVIR